MFFCSIYHAAIALPLSMQREIMSTADGSVTITIPEMHVTYHSRHGAIQESMHVYIEAGLRPLLHRFETITVFEMGFGTGLNALLTLAEAEVHQQKINYQTIEAYPLEQNIVQELNYVQQLKQMIGHAGAEPSLSPTAQEAANQVVSSIQPVFEQQQTWQSTFEQLHQTPWNQSVNMSAWFTLTKYDASLLDPAFAAGISQRVHVIYYDAFAPAAQPELWTAETFTQLYNMLEEGGILVTYCSKADVRRAMQAAGFTVEKIPGPRGKREMVRAKKTAGV